MDGCKVGSDGVGNSDYDGVGKGCAEDSGENGGKSFNPVSVGRGHFDTCKIFISEATEACEGSK